MPNVEYTCGCGQVFATRAEYMTHLDPCEECGDFTCPYQLEDYGGRCSWCGVEEEGASDGVFDYGYKPEPIWFGGCDASYYLGFELEISTSWSASAQPIYEWAAKNHHHELFYCKEDGSVSGFEIVSHPMTRDFFDTVDWPDFFKMLNSTYPNGYEEPEGHGLHVHVSRTAFPRRSSLARFCYLLNTHRREVDNIARRHSHEWAAFTDRPVSHLIPFWHEGMDLAYDYASTSHGWSATAYSIDDPSKKPNRQVQDRVQGLPPRYSAVNLQPRETVEVRLFRSTRSAVEFRESIHTVAAAVDFANMQPCTNTSRAASWDAFRDYVTNHPVFSYSLARVA